jgi:hypothetical protein
MKQKIDEAIEFIKQQDNGYLAGDYTVTEVASLMVEFLEHKTKALIIPNVVGQSGQLPTLIEIDFDGHLKCQVETTDIKPKILKAVNGYGQSVDCREGKIKISEV